MGISILCEMSHSEFAKRQERGGRVVLFEELVKADALDEKLIEAQV